MGPGSYAVLSVKDDGAGISPDILANIFDPFFTTKEKNKGTGLGLSTVHGIVKQSGGDIVVASELGQGSEFKVYLPLTSRSVTATGGVGVPETTIDRQATETILLVEDEDAVSGLIERVLLREGYHVVVAGNGVEALAVVESRGLKPDLLLTDVVMPEMGGPELAKILAPRLPDMKILFASGYTDNALLNGGVLDDGVDLIQKPFAPRDLLARLRKIFESA